VFQAAENLFGIDYTHIPYQKIILNFMWSYISAYAVTKDVKRADILQPSGNGGVLIGRRNI
jgi:hypothetical protein